MTLKDTLKSAIIMFPSITPNKLSAYNHLFLTVGNGYKWKNGELVSCEDIENCTTEKGLEKLFNDEFQYKLLKSNLETNLYDDTNKIVDCFKRENKQKLKLVKRIINVENVIEEELHITNDDYLSPLNEYTAIMNIPDDVKEDWKEGIKEFYNFIMTSQEPNVMKYRKKYTEELSKIHIKIK